MARFTDLEMRLWELRCLSGTTKIDIVDGCIYCEIGDFDKVVDALANDKKFIVVYENEVPIVIQMSKVNYAVKYTAALCSEIYAAELKMDLTS